MHRIYTIINFTVPGMNGLSLPYMQFYNFGFLALQSLFFTINGPIVLDKKKQTNKQRNNNYPTNHIMNCMSLYQAMPPPPLPHFSLNFSISLAQDVNGVVTLPSSVVQGFRGHRKKFLDPRSTRFFFLSKLSRLNCE